MTAPNPPRALLAGCAILLAVLLASAFAFGVLAGRHQDERREGTQR